MKTDIKFSVSYKFYNGDFILSVCKKNASITQASALEYTLIKIDRNSDPKFDIYFV